MVEKVEVVVLVRSRRLNDVDWSEVQLWMKRPCVEPRLKGLAEQGEGGQALEKLEWAEMVKGKVVVEQEPSEVSRWWMSGCSGSRR